mgnify:FL=1
MFTIKRHGVVPQANGLTATQNLLADPDTAPVLVIGAPTGAGKTFGFQKLIQSHGKVVLFVVPTQALARDICENLERQGLYAKQWDSAQTRAAVQRGQSTWSERLQSLTVEAGRRGGMVVATLEAFHGITLGWPTMKKVDLDVLDIFDQVDWLVFDEAHLLTERAMGFLALWAVLIGYRRMRCGERTRLALLSATHGAWVDFLANRDRDTLVGLPPAWVGYREETTLDLDGASPDVPSRPIHHEVTVHVRQGKIRELAPQLVPELLARHHRVLLIYDSLAALGLDESLLATAVRAVGLADAEGFVVNSQDKQLERTAGSARFRSGRQIPSESRLIVGTSAIEVGLNLAEATAMISDKGLNAAALLQRIGRIARGDASAAGEVYVVYERPVPHIIKLESLDGARSIPEVITALKPLIPFNSKTARFWSAAYFNMLSRQNRNLHRGFDQVLAAIEADEGQRPLSQKSLLAAAHREVAALPPSYRYLDALRKWLAAVDRTLQDLRGFTPTVKVRFENTPVFECQLDFVQKRLPLPDEYRDDVLVYHGPRDRYLKAKPTPIQVPVLTPFREQWIDGVWNEQDLWERYRQIVEAHRESGNPRLKSVVAFARCSGLVPRAPNPLVANAAQEGSVIC